MLHNPIIRIYAAVLLSISLSQEIPPIIQSLRSLAIERSDLQEEPGGVDP